MALKQAAVLMLLSVAFWLPAVTSAQQPAVAPVPALSAHVIDQTGTLTSREIASLDQSLRAYEQQTGSEFAVLIVPTTAPETIEQYGIRVADQWQLGRKKIDDGLILIVAKADRKVRFEVGYGLEGALTDATSKHIIDGVIVPRFKQQDFYGGITQGVKAAIDVLAGESLPKPAKRQDDSEDMLYQVMPVVFIAALILGRILRAFVGRTGGASVTGLLIATVAWFLLGVLSTAILAGIAGFIIALTGIGIGGRGLGGGARGGGGGGFRGGGGGFGGGGASGRW